MPGAIFTFQHGERSDLQSWHFTFRRAESHWCCCRGVRRDRHPSPALHPQGDIQEWDAFLDPWAYQAGAWVPPLMAPHVSEGLSSLPWALTGSPRPLWEKQTLYLYEGAGKKPLHSSPQRQFEYLNLPQTDCPCQWLLVQDVAQLWFLKQSTACNTARSLCCNADFK